jgi:hypothetical protein
MMQRSAAVTPAEFNNLPGRTATNRANGAN